jgi:dTDP-4-amino-4,6-dideoxygalactose transaminase
VVRTSKHKYNPWPLGQLPESFQRPEPAELIKKGYEWQDPRDIVDIFESKLAAYAGCRYAVTTDSCSNSLFLALKLRGVSGPVEIPAQTYASVPMQIYHAGAKPVLRDIEWTGIYQLGTSGIYDSAARFTRNMFMGGESLQCLSFQIKKRLPIGRGGAILTNSLDEYLALKRLVYDGRDLTTPYTDENHVNVIGYHCYMTPEDAARGILLMDSVPSENPDTMDFSHYPDLRLWRAIREISG